MDEFDAYRHFVGGFGDGATFDGLKTDLHTIMRDGLVLSTGVLGPSESVVVVALGLVTTVDSGELFDSVIELNRAAVIMNNGAFPRGLGVEEIGLGQISVRSSRLIHVCIHHELGYADVGIGIRERCGVGEVHLGFDTADFVLTEEVTKVGAISELFQCEYERRRHSVIDDRPSSGWSGACVDWDYFGDCPFEHVGARVQAPWRSAHSSNHLTAFDRPSSRASRAAGIGLTFHAGGVFTISDSKKSLFVGRGFRKLKIFPT